MGFLTSDESSSFLGPEELVTWYVRNDGDDANDGRTALTAFASLERAASNLVDDRFGFRRQRIDLTGFDGVGAEPLTIAFPRSSRSYDIDLARDVTAPQSDFYDLAYELYAEPEVVRSVTVTSVDVDATTGMPVLNVSDVLTPDELVGLVYYEAAFTQGVVESNTANQILLGSSSSGLSTGTFSLYRQSCTLQYGDATTLHGVRIVSPSSVAINGIKFLRAGTGSSAKALSLKADDWAIVDFCHIDGLDVAPAAFVHNFYTSFITTRMTLEAPCSFQACAIKDCTSLLAHGAGSGLNSLTYSVVAGSAAWGGDNYENPIDVEVSNCWFRGALEDAIRIDSPVRSAVVDCRIDDSAGSAILLNCAGGLCKTRNVTGTGNAEYGLDLRQGAGANYQYSIAPNTVTGTLGDVKLPGLDVQPWTRMPITDRLTADGHGCMVLGGPSVDEFAPGASATASSDVVFRPDGVAGGSVYTSWEDALAALDVLRAGNGDAGAYRLVVDGSVAAASPIVIPVAAPTDGTPDGAFTFASPTVTLEDSAAAFTADMVGRWVTIASATSPGNNGVFRVTGVPDATHLEYDNPSGVAEAEGAATYSITTPWDLRGTRLVSAPGSKPVLSFADGLTMLGLRSVAGMYANFNSVGDSPPVCSDFTTDTNRLLIDDGAVISNPSGGSSVWSTAYAVGAVDVQIHIQDSAALGQSGGSCFHLAAPNTAYLYASSSAGIWAGGFSSEVGSTIVAQLEKGAIWGPHSLALGTIIDLVAFFGPQGNLSPAAGAAAHTTAQNLGVFTNFVRYDVSGGAIAQTLPTLPLDGGYYTPGLIFHLEEVSGSEGLTLVGQGGDTINGSADPFPVPPGGSVSIASDGASNWTVLSVHNPHNHSPNVALTLGAAATEIQKSSRLMTITGDAGANTIGTIAGGVSGEELTLIFADALVTITDDGTATADTVNLSAAFTSAANTVLKLVYDGTSWYEISRSVN